MDYFADDVLESDDRQIPPGSEGAAARGAPFNRDQPRARVTLRSGVPGRARLHVKGLHRSLHVKDAVESDVARLAGVVSVSASTRTGNVLVIFATTLPLSALIDALGRTAAAAAGTGSVRPGSPRPIAPPRDRRSAKTRARTERQPPLQPSDEATAPLWHCLSERNVAERTGCRGHSGLPASIAAERLRHSGNTISRPRPKSRLAMVVEQVATLPVALLAGSAVLSIATGGLADAGVILGVVAINAVIGYVTESAAEKTIRALSAPQEATVTVVRDGQAKRIPLEAVVVGDVQVLEPGCFVAGDGRVIEARDLSVDESLLTGESMPVGKTTAVLADSRVPLAERCNMVYRGTAVTGGSGLAITVATGAATQIGRIQALVDTTRAPDTPMQAQLDSIGRTLAWISGGVCLLVVALGLLRGGGFLHMLRAGASLAVAAVPEGLPAVATTTLALGIRRMRRHGILVRHLGAVETLGAVQIVCFDKTGTLTHNRMSVMRIATSAGVLHRHEGRFHGNGASSPADAEVDCLLRVAVLCNQSDVEGEDAKPIIIGSPTEAALVDAAVAQGVDVQELRRRHPVIGTDHRSENRHFMQTVHEREPRGRFVAVKGSPLAVLDLCRWAFRDGKRHELTDDVRARIAAQNDAMADDALRVLGFAYGESDADDDSETAELTWTGLAGMADPARDGIADLMRQFADAGIITAMVTGDQKATARAVGRTLGITNGNGAEIIEPGDLDRCPPDQMPDLVARTRIFARVSPRTKLQIVRSLQESGKVVIMTGDGVNDSPALRAADIGVAMGRSGTDVARDVSDVVLDGDELETLVSAISQGRTIHGNVRKSLRFLLATNLSEILVMVGGVAVGAQPLTPMQLLWINLVTDVFPGLALALEPPHERTMQRPPVDPEEAILRSDDFRQVSLEGGLISASSLAAYGLGSIRGGPAQAASMAFTSLVVAQLLHAFTCRSENSALFGKQRLPRNRYLQVAMAGTFALQLAAHFVPGLRGLLGLAALKPMDALVSVGLGVLPFLTLEAAKAKALPSAEEAPHPRSLESGESAGSKRQPAMPPIVQAAFPEARRPGS